MHLQQVCAIFHLKCEVTAEIALLNEYSNHSIEVIFIATTICTKYQLEILNGRYHLGGLGRREVVIVNWILWKWCVNFLIEFGIPVKIVRLIKIHVMKLGILQH
jgi:hypothetical protein